MAEFIIKPSLSATYEALKGNVHKVRAKALLFHARCAAGPVTVTEAAQYMEALKDTLDTISQLAASYPSKALADWAVVQQAKAGYDPTTEYANVMAAATVVLSTLRSVLPTKGAPSVDATYKFGEQTFSVNEMEGFRAQLLALVATIGAP